MDRLLPGQRLSQDSRSVTLRSVVDQLHRTKRVAWCILLLALVLTACGGGEAEATAAPTSAVAREDAPGKTATVVTTPTAGVVDGGTATVVDDTNAQEMTSTVPSTAVPEGSSAVFVPLEVEETTDCEIESDLDLAGFPDLESRLGCPTGAANFDPVAINEFGPGPEFDRFMLWFGNEGRIYVLLPDGSWESYEDTWQEGDATFACNPLGGEPESPPLPRRGFGKIWCEVDGLQDVLGSIVREERLCQHAVTQPFADGRLLACFEDATIRYFRIQDDRTWNVEFQ